MFSRWYIREATKEQETQQQPTSTHSTLVSTQFVDKRVVMLLESSFPRLNQGTLTDGNLTLSLVVPITLKQNQILKIRVDNYSINNNSPISDSFAFGFRDDAG